MTTSGAKKWQFPMLDRGARIHILFTSVASLLNKTRLSLLLIFLFVLSSLQLIDPDYFWHLKAGEYIVANHALPSGDIFSYTRLGQHWILHEWLFEVLLYGFFYVWGSVGVKLLTATFLTVSIILLLGIAQLISRHSGAAIGVTMIALIPLMCSVVPRPQLVTYAFFTVYLYCLLSFKYCQAKISWFTMPVLMVIWVNAHGGFAIGIALLFIFTICEWLAFWMAGSDDPERRQHLVRLTKVGTVTILASLANPGFVTHWLYPFQVLGMTANHAIAEWQSPNFHDPRAQGYLILVFAFFASYAYASGRPDATELVIPGLFMFAGFTAWRHTPLAALALTPFTARALASGAIPAITAAWRGSRLARWYGRQAGARELGRTEFLLNWLVLLAVLTVLVGFAPVFQAKEQTQATKVLPVGAADFVLTHRITGNMFNNYDDGGYLIYRLAPARKVFIDGRADLYGDQFVEDFLDIYNGKANWKSKFDRLSIDYAIVGKDAPIRQLLKATPEFKEVFFDDHFSVLLRNRTPDSVTR